jgi:transposase
MKYVGLRKRGMTIGFQGVTCPEAANLLGDAPRTVQYWVRRFEEEGFANSVFGYESRGRLSQKQTQKSKRSIKKKLNENQLVEVGQALRKIPRNFGLSSNIWDGKTLSAFIKQQFEINIGVRQCQRLFRQLGFRLRKPRPVIAKADTEKQKKHKKN